MSVDQFLNRLPKVVVKAGRVIDIRDSLRDILQVKTPVQHHLSLHSYYSMNVI